MRRLHFLPLLAFLASCAPQKPQFPMPDQSQAGPRTQVRNPARQRQPEPEAAPARNTRTAQSTSVGNTPALSPQVVSGWAVTSIKGKFLAVDTSAVRVYLSLTTSQPSGKPMTVAAFAERFVLNYVIYPDYNVRERLAYGNVPLTAGTLVQTNDRLMLTFTIPRPKGAEAGVLLSEISEVGSGKKALNDLPIRFKPTKLADKYALFDATGKLPLLQNYVRAEDTITIRDVSGSTRPLFAYRYKHEFDPALPPMVAAQRSAPRMLTIDTMLVISTNVPVRLPGEGLYYFVQDTTDQSGIGLRVADSRFPRMTRPERLVKPLLYMSTGTEIAELNATKAAKKSIDRYWLTLMAGNEDVAKQALRAYYGRVEEANKLFTTYKEGWKTDKGMIFIILGSPDRVQRSRDREVWVYNRRENLSEVNFTFNRKQNQFVEDHYELVRYSEYQPIWYPIVEAWRTGAIRE